MSDLRPQGHTHPSELRLGYEASPHALEWPDPAGDCGPVDCFGHETYDGDTPKCIVRDVATGAVLMVVW